MRKKLLTVTLATILRHLCSCRLSGMRSHSGKEKKPVAAFPGSFPDANCIKFEI